MDKSDTKPDSRLIFVYGSLRSSEYNFARANGWGRGVLTPVGEGYIEQAQMHDLGSYPALVKANDTRTVHGELMECPLPLFGWLDRMEVGAGYRADDVEFIPLDGSPRLTATAWFYADPSELTHFPVVESGDWCKRDKK